MKTTLVCMRMFAAACAAACASGKPDNTGKGVSGANAAAPPNPAAWTVTPVNGSTVNGSRVTGSTAVGRTTDVIVNVVLQAGWHIYAITQPAPGPTGGPIATRITLPLGQPYTLAGTPIPAVAPEVKYDEAFRMNVQEHSGSVSFHVPARRTAPQARGDSVHVDVRYQVCNATLCFPPQTAKLAAPVSATPE